MLSKYRTILRIQFLRPGSRDPLHGIPVMHSLTSVHVRTVHVRTVHVRTVHVRTAHVRTAHGRTAHGRTAHGRTAWSLGPCLRRLAHTRVARSTLGPRSRACSPHAHTYARPTRACAGHTRSTHSLALWAHPCARPTDEGHAAGGTGRRWTRRQRLRRTRRWWARRWRTRWRRLSAATTATVADVDISACGARHRRA